MPTSLRDQTLSLWTEHVAYKTTGNITPAIFTGGPEAAPVRLPLEIPDLDTVAGKNFVAAVESVVIANPDAESRLFIVQVVPGRILTRGQPAPEYIPYRVVVGADRSGDVVVLSATDFHEPVELTGVSGPLYEAAIAKLNQHNLGADLDAELSKILGTEEDDQ